MKNDVFITICGIIIILFLYIAGQNSGMSLIALLVIAYNSYCAYRYQGKNSLLYASIPVILFILFIASSVVDKTLANILMLIWLGSLVYFAMNTIETKPVEVEAPKAGRYCHSCGKPIEKEVKFCPECGAEQ